MQYVKKHQNTQLVEIRTENEHLHELKDLDILKKPQELVQYVQAGAAKKYPAPVITEAAQKSDLPATMYVKSQMLINLCKIIQAKIQPRTIPSDS